MTIERGKPMKCNSFHVKKLTRRIWGVRGAGSVFKRPSNGRFYACDAVGRIVGDFEDFVPAVKEASKWTLEKSLDN